MKTIAMTTHDARQIDSSVAPAPGWAVETWVIHEKGHPGRPVAQVQLFRDTSAWCLWTGNITRAATRTLGHALAVMRNALERKEAA